MKVLIVDDEPLSLSRLERLLREAGVNMILSAENAYQAKDVLKKNHDIDAVFIDVKMPGKSGIELALELRQDQMDLFIVFQTAYEEYALSAFKVGAVGYLIKPFFLEDVVETINRIRKFKGEKPQIYFVDKTGKIFLRSCVEIYFFKAQLKHSIGYLKEGQFRCLNSIQVLEKALKPFGFFRIHKSYLINLNKVKNWSSLPDGKIEINFLDLNITLKTSRLGAKKLREFIRATTKPLKRGGD
ncbi:LytR/AlgR family response regulator transcription factor [Thermodesulfobacterium hveragerdense]|uniref:LytR/AlgR family response regulator transcription factor n=1 Tax=Thermodesulfobacterium hveragerdense TaxID=53424 RepID=UPI000688A3C6|nr:LytTR family DNA-binding domain-containing protein [Thermodesulfobacterium hveragerdense]